jgi:hypothetical protein
MAPGRSQLTISKNSPVVENANNPRNAAMEAAQGSNPILKIAAAAMSATEGT